MRALQGENRSGPEPAQLPGEPFLRPGVQSVVCRFGKAFARPPPLDDWTARCAGRRGLGPMTVQTVWCSRPGADRNDPGVTYRWASPGAWGDHLCGPAVRDGADPAGRPLR